MKWARQRVRRGYSDYDVGDIDVWFDSIVPDMLLDFKNNIIGYPMRLQYEYYEEHKNEIGVPFEDLLAYPNGSSSLCGEWHRMDDACRQRWKSLIEEMRFLFLEANEDTCTKYPFYETDRCEYSQKFDEIDNYRNECRRKAIALFCEWFEYLWQ